MRQTIYLDTTIPSAYYDDRNPERQKETKIFWERLKGYSVFVSQVVFDEISQCNDKNKQIHLLELLEGIEKLPINEECKQLADLYIKNGVIPLKYEDDAMHIAIAVVNSIDYLISWNFEHIVKVKTRRMVGLIDAEKGYKPIEIISPPEL